jgi:acyl-coenzyme A synthetase/AMP-(fatty) acid ligase
MSQSASLPLVKEANARRAMARDGPDSFSTHDFLQDVHALAGALPAGEHVLNFCRNRYRFLVGFGASLVAGKVSLLPSTRTPHVLRQIQEDFPGTFCLHDGDGLGTLGSDADAREGGLIELFDYPAHLPHGTPGDAANPQIPARQVAVRVFTSGSTGAPVPHTKSWGSLVASARSEAAALGLGGQAWGLIGTVPSQHMYGFESLIMLALQAGASLWAGHPFYPADVFCAIESMPRPRMLVTSPAHLRALMAARAPYPAVDKLLSATAMLPQELARQAQQNLGAPLYEIYGSTETGQIAIRGGADARHWTLFSGVELEQRDGRFWARGGHIAEPTPLSDILHIVDRGRFELVGRSTDMINIAGRRSSLEYLNHALLAVPGVIDGCVFVPDPPSVTGDSAASMPDSARPCAIVVAPQASPGQILRSLRAQVDPVFLPRPIIFVQTLPRNATGKIPRDILRALYEEHRRQRPGRTR